MRVESLTRSHDFFADYRIHSKDGKTYLVEIRSLLEPVNSCNCPDHRINGLATCKHIEAVAQRLQQYLACMRMLCDTPYILDQNCRISPKLKELGNILSEMMEDGDHKIIIFSEWERMLQLVREQADELGLDHAWHTGSVSQTQRRGEIRRFKTDPDCRLFLSTDSGSVGLNLQVADVVINLDMPWNPARLEPRIARAWRKHQNQTARFE